MRTRKPISTISYNTEAFLKARLDSWIEEEKIEYYMYIHHKAEQTINVLTGEMDREKKDHIHLHIIPNKTIDTKQLREDLMEQDPTNPLRPLGCILFEQSKTSDWTLYALHDETYLASKLQVRQYHYRSDELKSSDNEIRDQIIYDAYHDSILSDNKVILEAIKRGELSRLISSGYITPANAQRIAAFVKLEEKARLDAEQRTLAKAK